MSLPIPLTVRLSTARADKHIERDLRSLSFRSVAPGGFASAQFSLDRPLSSSPDEIAYYGDVDIYDARNGNCVWCGRLEDPGRGVGADGQVWDLAAVGPAAHAQDRTVPRIYVDRNLNNWYTSGGGTTVKGSEFRVVEYELDDTLNSLFMLWQAGATANVANAMQKVRYARLREANQRLARFDYRHVEGRTHADLEVRAVVQPSNGGIRTDTFSTSETGPNPKVMTTDFANTNDMLEMTIRWTGAVPNTFTGDNTWTSIGGLYVMAQRADKSGATVGASGYTDRFVRAHEVVEDLLGILLPQYDGANAVVATNSFGIDHLAYPDGVTPAKIFDDLMIFEPGYFWQATDRMPNGKFRFEWKAWPTTVRYEADLSDGYSSTGSADGLFNGVMVRWRDDRGWIRYTPRTQTVPELTAAGLTRDAFIDLGDEVASAANADQAGDQFLAEHMTPPNAGQLTVSRPIYDHDRGMSVMPWEIRPGNLIRVRGIRPNTNSLNVTDRDGVTVFQIVGVDYDTASASATLELDSYSPTVARALAALSGRGGMRAPTRGATRTFGANTQRRR